MMASQKTETFPGNTYNLIIGKPLFTTKQKTGPILSRNQHMLHSWHEVKVNQTFIFHDLRNML